MKIQFTLTITFNDPPKSGCVTLSYNNITMKITNYNILLFILSIWLSITCNACANLVDTKNTEGATDSGQGEQDPPADSTDPVCQETNPVTESLFDAISSGSLEAVKKILDSESKGEICCKTHSYGHGLLFFACDNCAQYARDEYLELIRMLLDLPNLDVNENLGGQYFLENQIMNSCANLELIKMLLEKGAKVDQQTTIMHIVMDWYGGDISIQNEKLEWVIQEYHDCINTQDAKGNTPLHLAVKKVSSYNIDAIQKLKQKELDWDIKNKKGLSPKDFGIEAMQNFCDTNSITYKGEAGSGEAWELYKKFEQTCGL